MSDTAILVEKLSKKYVIHHQPEGKPSLRDRVASLFAGREFTSGNGQPATQEVFWALKDVSFEVKQGDRIGVIGGNGAGKSTLLKILSMITEPSEGCVTVHGRVASLLEVGTGFHPELSGRENIFLNGALLGMHRSEIRKKFDEIVDFAGVEKFLDTPVKRYSSGMYVRLAFAVAAHLESQVLIVDEVLAVGDAKFQERCLGKMKDVQKDGRTVLFVSHSMAAVQSLCNRCVLLKDGTVVAQGDTRDIVTQYLNDGAPTLTAEWLCPTGQSDVSSPHFAPIRVAVVDESMAVLTGPVDTGHRIGVVIEVQIDALHPLLSFGFALFAAGGELLFWSLHTDTAPERWPSLREGMNRLVAWIPSHLLNEGDYRVDLHAGLHFQSWFSQPGVNAPSVFFSVRGGFIESPNWTAARPGLLAPTFPFASIEP